MSPRNPFDHFICGTPVSHQDAEGRLSAVKGFNLAQLRDALKVKGLQKAVQYAIERRIDQMADHHHNSKRRGKKS